ncbi:MAG TPA: hypothetical protein VH518_18190 [Tepidisphaeraceae bacterium]
MNSRCSIPALLIVLLSLSCAARAESATPLPAQPSAPPPKPLFDPARHMRVSEVHPGMKGYGLSVFSGTKIDRFDVEVISVLHNFNPKYDVVLIKCHGADLEHTGSIAGMSGSPIYLTDDQGRDRLIGAFAYGWPLLKDPLAGVQPIEYMLEVGSTLRPEPAATQQVGNFSSGSKGKLFRINPLNPPFKLPIGNNQNGVARQLTGNDAPQLQPLATPLMTAGLPSKLIEQYAPLLREYGLIPLQSGGISGSPPSTQPAEIVPGSVLAAPLLTGDVEFTAIGTCTEVIGDRIFGFGHPFNNEGPITLPMGAGQISGIIARLDQSFKLGAMTDLRGTLIADQSVGVAGKLGKAPPTIPIDVHVIYTDGSMDVTYHFDACAHPRLTPLLSSVAVNAALSGRRDLPQYHTVEYDLRMDFANGQTVEAKNVAVNSAAAAIFQGISLPIVLASDNPFERVMLKKVSGTVRVTPEAHEADILSVTLPKQKYRPGETLKAFVRYRPFRAGEETLPIELQLPHNLRDGTYQLSVGDQSTYIQQEQMARPFRFTAESIEDVFAVLKDVSSIRNDALYVQLLRQADGVAVGRTAMPLLPSSRRQVLLDAGRSNVTAFVSAASKIIPTKTVIDGSAQFEIQIDSEEHVSGAKGPKTDQHGLPQPAPAPAPGEGGGGNKPKLQPRPDVPGAPKSD